MKLASMKVALIKAMATEKTYTRLAQVFAMLVLGVIIFTFQDYGISWDEEIQSQYGQAIVDYYLSGFVDHRFDQIFNLYLYGGMFDGLASFLDRTSPLGIYPTRHLLNALFGLLGMWGTWRLGRLLGGGGVGLVALVLVALTPMFYGHIFNNPKDIPFAAGVMWSLYYMGKGFRLKPVDISWPLMVKLGIILGLTLGIRVGGIMLPGYWGMIYLVQQRRDLFSSLRFPIFIGLIAYVVMLICWPWAQQNPIMNPLRALSEFSNFPQDVEVLLNGTIYRSTQLPWFYVLAYFGVQLPLLLLALTFAACCLARQIWRQAGTRHGDQSTLALITLMICAPIAYATIRRPALYDAVRHFIFVIPLLCVLSALGFRRMLTILLTFECPGQKINEFVNKFVKKLICTLLALLLLVSGGLQLQSMVELHPYQYIYINPIEGGVAGAFGQYELDYWGSSFKEAAEKLQDYVSQEGGVPSGRIYRIAVCGPWSAAMIYLPPDFEAVRANEEADFFLSTTRWNCQTMRDGREIITIKRQGAPLSVIKDLR